MANALIFGSSGVGVGVKVLVSSPMQLTVNKIKSVSKLKSSLLLKAFSVKIFVAGK